MSTGDAYPSTGRAGADAGAGLRFGSFCSGIGAPEVAWSRLGWVPQFNAEIEPFPCTVLAHHFPGVRNFGDMTAIDPAELPDADLLVAGTPCQAFSVAGLRWSLSDHRGNLTLHFVKLIHARNPRIVVWENVPGVLSTKDNAFGCFLAGLVGEAEPLVCGEGSWPDAGMVAGPVRSAAWRILDAQYFGVAQRRRRVFVVSFRTGDGINPGAVLFEPESVCRDTPPSREAGTRVAASLTRGADSGGKGGYAGRRREDDFNLIANCLDRHMGCGGPDDNAAQANHLIPHLHADISAALKARDGKGPSSDGDGDGAILVPMVTHSLRADGFDASEDGTGRGTPLVPVAIQEDNQNGVTIRGTTGSLRSDAPGTQPCGTLIGQPIPIDMRQACPTSNPAIAYTIHGTDKTARVASETALVGSLRTKPPGSIENSSTTVVMAPIPIDMRQASRGGTMTNHRGEDACSGGAPGTGIGEAGDPAPSMSQSHPAAVAYGIHSDALDRSDATDLYKCGTCSHTESHDHHVERCPTCGADDYENVMIRPRYGPNVGREWDFSRQCWSDDPEDAGAIAFDTTQITSDKNFSNPKPGDPCHPLASGAHPPAVAFQERGRDGGRSIETQDDLAYSLNAPSGGGRRQELNVATPTMAVRRLTPRECERLQGFPDDFTAIPFRGKPAADGPRYRALGNSMAVPVVEWLGRRIALVTEASR